MFIFNTNYYLMIIHIIFALYDIIRNKYYIRRYFLIQSAKKVLRIPCFTNKRGIRLPNQFVLNCFFRPGFFLSQTSCLLIPATLSAYYFLRIPQFTS